MRDMVAGLTISLSANAVTEMGPRLSITDRALSRSGVMPCGSSMLRNWRVSRENWSCSKDAISVHGSPSACLFADI